MTDTRFTKDVFSRNSSAEERKISRCIFLFHSRCQNLPVILFITPSRLLAVTRRNRKRKGSYFNFGIGLPKELRRRGKQISKEEKARNHRKQITYVLADSSVKLKSLKSREKNQFPMKEISSFYLRSHVPINYSRAAETGNGARC